MTREEFCHWANRFPEAFLLVTGDGRIAASNAAGATFLGCSPGEAAKHTLSEYLASPPESLAGALKLWSASGQMLFGAVRLRGKHGAEFRAEGSMLAPKNRASPTLLLLRLKRMEAAVGKFLSLNETIERLSAEIHARKRSEGLIRQQREWLHVTLSSIGDAVMATSVDGRLEFMNHEAERLTGWKADEVRGQPIVRVFDIFNESTREPVENPVARVIESGHVVGLANHTVLKARDGMCRPIEDSAAPIRDAEGQVIGAVLVFRDVSQKQKAQRALAESERRFRLLTEMNVIAAGVSDLIGTFVDGNDALLQLLGYTRDELEAGFIKWRDITPPEHLPKDAAAIAEARARGACRPYEKEYLHRSGRRIPIIIGYALFKAPVRYRHQESDDLAMCFILDISERRRVEEVLESKVAERTARLQEALTELEAFSYTISHDLRAPLRSMQSYSQLLLEEHSAGLDDEAKGFLKRIVRSGEHLDGLIQDVLTYAKVSKASCELTSIDLHALLTEWVERYPNFSAPGVRIEISSSLPRVLGNDALLTQVFANLIGNAIKFVRPGSTPHVKVYGAHDSPDRVRVWVEDNGIGIAAAHRDRIFGLFERIQTGTTYPGTGIGLSVVRKAIDKMGGHVGLESEAGAGSRFWVELAPG